MSPLRSAVIGCGHLGRIHAQLLAGLDHVELVAVVDPNPEARASVAAKLGVPALEDYRALRGQIDAAVLATPTCFHAAMAAELLDAGVHLLVEKPLAAEHAAAKTLAHRAAAQGLVLAVGHVERFNPAFVAVQQRVDQPLYLEATRTGGFTFRSLDVGVVMDLMIHDLELILAMVPGRVAEISACGAPVVTAHEDFAEARLVFSNGCVAVLKASRTSPVAQRVMTVYDREAHYFIDFGQRHARVLQRNSGLQAGTLHVEQLPADEIESLKDQVFETLLPTTELAIPDANPLRDELQDFVDSIRQGRAPRVDGVQGARAVDLAERILRQIQVGRLRRAGQPLRRAA